MHLYLQIVTNYLEKFLFMGRSSFYKPLCIFFILNFFLFSCTIKTEEVENTKRNQTLFTLLDPAQTNIDFENTLVSSEEFNTYLYRNFYNGGGVGIGDINNDGLPDVYFCGNMQSNKLYLNKGNFQFEDITEKAGVACQEVWSSGVSFADINADGLLDIYVCKSGTPGGENRNNELFINNGDLTFTEKSKEYGIADEGLSTHAVFFDYDRDGDLDCYLLNNSIRSVGGYDIRTGQREVRDRNGGNKLYRNDRQKFVDVSEEAGIYGSAIGFGLGVTIGDINRDGWQDIYVSNDFFERDYLYINNADGTFSESIEEQMPEISLSSMGADMADINDDGYPEVFVTDMLPESNERMKTKTAFESWDTYQSKVKNGYHHQFTRNTLQLNRGNNTYAEIGRFADVFATDWSWGALIADYDNDGKKDIFVANGIYKDLTDQDYINFYSDPSTMRSFQKKEKNVLTKLVDAMPSVKVANYAFKNEGGLQFTDKAEDWGLATPSHSNGSAYADLDNDGDLDLVINNVNMPAFVYRNEANSLLQKNNWLRVKVKGKDQNTFALGTKITIYKQGEQKYQELAPMRGFQSNVDNTLVFGLGTWSQVDSLVAQWPDGSSSTLTQVTSNQEILLDWTESTRPERKRDEEQPSLFNLDNKSLLTHTHVENDFKDFDRDRLIYHMLSAEGPRVAKGDVNQDGLEDIFIGGSKDDTGKLYLQKRNGGFTLSPQNVFDKDAVSEDTDCLFFDADNDNDLDLYVASGGNEFPASAPALLDRLYINDGRGNFTKSDQLLPSLSRFEATSCVVNNDFDQDGDQDLFVGVRLKPFSYGQKTRGYLLRNDGKGNFKDVTKTTAPTLVETEMITDAVWADFDGDELEDLLLSFDWGAPLILFNKKGQLEPSENVGLSEYQGWWNRIAVADIDNDGDQDFIALNHGLNSRFKATAARPISMYLNDFDKNGMAEQIISVYNGDVSYPLALRHDLVMQLPSLKKKYLKYENYKNQTVNDIFSADQIEKSRVLTANYMESSVFLNQGNGSFEVVALPKEAQFAPLYALKIEDFDNDGKLDLLTGGNFYRAKPEVGIYAATFGLYLQGDGTGNFKFIPPKKSGVNIPGEIRDFTSLKIGGKQKIIVIRNNENVLSYTINN